MLAPALSSAPSSPLPDRLEAGRQAVWPRASDSVPYRHGVLRLTRRGRLVVVCGVLALLLAVGFTLGRVSASSAAPTRSPLTATVRVGDTLWSLATRAQPRRDPRTVVAQLRAINHLPSDRLEAGQQLALPN